MYSDCVAKLKDDPKCGQFFAGQTVSGGPVKWAAEGVLSAANRPSLCAAAAAGSLAAATTTTATAVCSGGRGCAQHKSSPLSLRVDNSVSLLLPSYSDNDSDSGCRATAACSYLGSPCVCACVHHKLHLCVSRFCKGNQTSARQCASTASAPTTTRTSQPQTAMIVSQRRISSPLFDRSICKSIIQ